MKDQYWNGYQWVNNPPMASIEPPSALPFDMSDVKDALLEAELNPRTITTEEVPLEVNIEVQPEEEIVPLRTLSWSSYGDHLEIPLPEQPTPNLADYNLKRDCPVMAELLPKTDITANHPINIVVGPADPVIHCDTIDKAIDVFSRNPVRRPEHEEEIAVGRVTTRDRQETTGLLINCEIPEEQAKVIDAVEEIKITEETRARIRRELGMDDGSSE